MKDLVGRSKNERKLDGIYNRQIKELIINKHKNEKRNSDIFLNLSKRSNNENIPFPEIYEKDKKKKYMDSLKGNVEKNKNLERKDNNDIIFEGEKEKKYHNDNINNSNSNNNNNNNSVVTIYKGIYMIIYKHIYSKNKFSKSLTIFINLCINYMNNDNKHIFFFAFDKIINTFNEKYLYNDNHDILKNNIYTFYNNNETHIKCMISFFDKVINKIIDNRFVIHSTYEENEHTEKKKNTQQLLKTDENITPSKKQSIQTKQHSSTNHDLCEKEDTTHHQTIVHITKEEKQFLKALKIKVYYIIILFKLNDNFIFNKLIGIYRQIFDEIQKEYNIYEHDETIKNNNNSSNDHSCNNHSCNNHSCNNHSCNNQDNINDNEEMIKNYFLFLKDKWIRPNEYQIFKMKRKAFVKCLSNLYHFINIKWAKTSVESLLQDVYMKKFMFDTSDEIIIENIQSSIKNNLNKRTSKFESSHVLSIGESLNPVVDARDEKIVSIHGSHVWSNKQMDR
ncbi:hypothetical protein PGSY75_0406000 [Plasmodium gaboni]|uniref:Uncharacterized protein n=1 Tax=Plasmodium gaboni TaxID=647221 RepID=A0A151LUA8_9APIC|nr:hypothetical protein PGSY75_0406000 [Plasmodium gaboni]KYO02769.1 hypothetical protein PGSY75_0406000 [Plasmodium gaboni]